MTGQTHSQAEDIKKPHNNDLRLVKQALILTVIFLTIEAIGGYLSGSLSLFSDAIHMLIDVSALLLTFGALRLGQTMPSKRRTFGYHRVETTAAFANACILILIAAWILWEAVQRISAPSPVQVSLMLPVAVVGFIVNLYIALRMHGSHDLSVKSAYLHVLADSLSSAVVIIAGVVIMFTGEVRLDPALSMLVSLFIIGSAIPVIRESGAILLQFAPPDVDFSALIADIESVPGVEGVHNVHLWSLCSHTNVLDAHIYTCVERVADQEVIKQEIKQRLEKYRVYHSTLEFECDECKDCSVVRPFRSP